MPSLLLKATPVIVVERIEPLLPFWSKLGAGVKVADAAASDGRLGFAIFAAEGIELMYQTAASIAGDTIASASSIPWHHDCVRCRTDGVAGRCRAFGFCSMRSAAGDSPRAQA
jgi:hypothetical protein